MRETLKKLIAFYLVFLMVFTSPGFFSAFFESPLLGTKTAEAAFNAQINYQGKLTNSSNVAVADGNYHMTFRLYTVPTGGIALWTEDRSTAPGDRIAVTNGLFSVMLGSSTPLTGIDFNQTLYLGVEIGGSAGAPSWDGEMSPRKIFGAVPSAFVARNVEGGTIENATIGATTPSTAVFTQSTTTSATSTNLFSSTASSTNLFSTNANLGYLILGRSTTSQATTTSLAITGLSNTLLKVNAIGSVVPAIAGTDYVSDTTGDWTGTFDGQEGSYYLANSFSTTSASYFLSQNQGNAFSTTSADYWLTEQDTDNLSEGITNLYFTDTRARQAISETITGIDYNNGTGVFSLTSGYIIPLSASTTNWNSFYDTPSTRITAGTNLSWSGNTLNGLSDSGIRALFSAVTPLSYNSGTGEFTIQQANSSQSGYLSATDWNIFNNKISSTSLSGTDPITYNSGTGAIGFNFAYNGTYTGDNIFNSILRSTTTQATTTSLFSTTASSTNLFSTNFNLGAGNIGRSTTTNATTTTLHISSTLTGANLSACDPSTEKLLWSNGQFTCGADAGAGGGITSLSAQYSSTQTGSAQTFATGTPDTNIQMTITSSGNIHTFTPVWVGSLADSRIDNNLTIDGGTINNTPIGAVTPSTAIFTNATATRATTTSLAITGLSNTLLKVNAIGSVVPAIAGTDYVANTTGDWTGTFDGQEGSYYLANSFSTTSASYFLSQNQGNAFSTTSADYWLTEQDTDSLSEGITNLYFTDTRARQAISETITGIDYNNGTGVFSLTSGYIIPLSASTTNWNSFYDTPSTRITAGTNLSWSGNTLNGLSDSGIRALFSAVTPLSYNSGTGEFTIQQANSSQSGYLSATDWNIFNNKISSTSLSGTDPITYNSGTGAIGFNFAYNGTYTGDNIFNSILRSTTTQATTTSLFSTTASSTNLFSTNFNLGAGNIGRSTTTNATTTFFAISGIASSILKTDPNGSVIPAIAGVDYSNFSYPFPSNATSTMISFNGGLTSLASTTIGASTQAGGLTISGGATTTGNLYVGGKIGIGTQSPVQTLDVVGTGRFSSTFTLSSIPSCTGAQALQTNGSGDLACGNITVSGASTGGGWTTDSVGNVTLATTTDAVGIGATTSPYAKLSVISSTAASTTLALRPASGATANIIDIYNTSGSLASVFSADHRLGIGTTNPAVALDVNGQINANNLQITGSSTLQNFTFVNATGTQATTTSLFSTTASSTNLFSTNANLGYLILGRSTTSQATTTSLAITGLSNTLLKVNAIGSVVPAIAGTDYVSDTTGDWTGTFDGQEGSYYLANSFSTTSASYFLSQNQGNAFSTTSADYWLTEQDTDNLSEGITNLYFTDTRARQAISETITGIDYNNGTGVFSLTSGYIIPLSASTTNWNSFYDTPSTRITAGTNLSWSGNTLNGLSDSGIRALFSAVTPLSYNSGTGEFTIQQANSSQSGYLSATDWNIFNNKISSTSLSGTDPITYNSGTGAIGFNFAYNGTYTGDNIFNSILRSTTTQATTTSLFSTTASSTNLFSTNFNLGAGNIGRSTTTNATTTSLFSTTASSTNLFSTNFNLGAGNIGRSTTSQATTTNLYTTIFGLNSEYFTDLTGAGLLNTGGVLTLNTTGDWTGTFDGQEGSYYLANSFSTTSASYFLSQNQGNAFSTTSADYWLTEQDTDNLSEGITNLYFTDTRARQAISETITGIDYNNGTGVFSLTSGYIIPLSASTTNWNSFYDTPSTRITAGTNLSWSGNTLNGLSDSGIRALFSAVTPLSYNSGTGEFTIQQANSSQSGYLSATDWNIFNNKISSTSLSGTDPITYNSGTGAIGFNFAYNGTYTGDNIFNSILRSTTTQATTTSLFSTTASSTNLFSTNFNLGAGNIGRSTTTQATTTSLAITGISSSLLKTNASGSVIPAIAGTDYENPLTFSSGLTRSVNSITCDTANSSTKGCLSSSDWTLFNNKISSSSLSGASVISYNSGTGVITTTPGTFVAGGDYIFPSGTLVSLGSTTLQNFTFQNATGTSATTTNFFSTTASSTNLFGTNANLGYLTVGRSTTSQATTTSLFSTTASSTNLFSTNFNLGVGIIGRSTTTQATTTSLFSTTASSTNLFSTNANLGLLTVGRSTTTNATTTSLFATTASSTNLFFTTANGGSITSTGIGTFSNLLINSSSTLQNFTFVNATGTSATTTNFFSATASSTNLFSTNFNVGVGTLGRATTSALAISSIPNAILSTNSSGSVVPITTSAGISSLITDETGSGSLVFSNLPTLSGFISNASSTVVGGLTVSGISTTTGNLVVQGTASSTFSSGINAFALNLTGTATSTFNNGLNIANGGVNVENGCFSVAGVCVGTQIAWSGITDPDTSLGLNMGTHSTSFNWETGTGASELFSLTTDASANGIGSLLYVQTGTGSSVNPLRVIAGSAESIFVDSSGRVGIGQTSLTDKFTVNGNSTLSGNVAISGNLTSAQATASTFAITSISSSLLKTNASGSVIPAIAGTDYSNFGYLFPLTGNATSTLTQFNGGLTAFASSTIGAGTQAGGLTISGGATTTGNAYFAGGVGIGASVSVPSSGIQINETGIIKVTLGNANRFERASEVCAGCGPEISFVRTRGTIASPTNVNNGDTLGDFVFRGRVAGTEDYWAKFGATKESAGGQINFETGTVANTTLTRMVITPAGNIGIGTTSPYAKLSVVGQVVGEYFTATSTTATSTFALGGVAIGSSTPFRNGLLTVGTSSPLIYVDRSTGNIGFGTTTPEAPLEIVSNSTIALQINRSGSQTAVRYDVAGNSAWHAGFFEAARARGTLGSKSAVQSGDTLFQINAGGYGQTSGTTDDARITILAEGTFTDASHPTAIAFTTTASGSISPTERLRINNSGNIGIGTTSPYAKLSVVGPVVAEYFHATSTTATSTFNGGLLATAGVQLSLQNCTAFSNGGKLTTDASGNVYCADDVSGGGGGSDVNWSFFNNSGIRLGTTTNQVLIGATATTSLSTLETAGEIRAFNFIGTSTTATSSFAGTLSVGSTTPAGNALFSVGATTQNLLVNKNTGAVSINVIGATPLTVSGSGDLAAVDIRDNTGGGNVRLNIANTQRSWSFGLSSSFNDGSFLFRDTTANATRMILDTAGRLGIGTTSPQWLLQLATSTRSQLTLSDPSSLTNNHWSFRNAGGNLYFATSSPSTFATSTTPALTIDVNGNVGVGTSSPYARLAVQGGIAGQFLSTYATNSTSTIAGGLNVNNGAVLHDFSSGVTSISNLELGALNFDTNAGKVSWVDMPVTSAAATGVVQSYTAQIDGNPLLTVYAESNGSGGIQNPRVSVGTTTPSATFSVWGNTADPMLAHFVSNASSSLFSVLNSGNVGIGTTSPYAKLSVVGPVVAEYFHATSTTASSTFSGGLVASRGVQFSLQNCTAFANGGKLTTDASGNVFCSNDTSGGGGGDYPFPLTGNATSTLTQFNGGLTAFASSTIGAGTQAGGLTISGGATTTGNAYFAGNVGIGTNSPGSKLTVVGGAISFGTSDEGIIFSDFNAGSVNISGLDVNGSAWNDLNFRTGPGDNYFRFNTSGRLGVASTTPWGQLSVEMNTTNPAFVVANQGSTTPSLFVGGVNQNGFVGIGTTTNMSSLARLTMSQAFTNETGSTNAIGGMFQDFTFSPTSDNAVQLGNRLVINNTPGTSATNTVVGQLIRINDSSGRSNLTRGLEVLASGGSNTWGVNTAIRAMGHTFGLQGITTGLAGGTSTPAAIYGENTGTTIGDVLRLYTSTMTSAPAIATFYQESSTFTGTGLLMDFARGTGGFTGNFVDFRKEANSQFSITDRGTTTIGQLNQTTNAAGLRIPFGSICVDNDGTCTGTTTGYVAAVGFLTGSTNDLAENFFSFDDVGAGDIIYAKGGAEVGKATDPEQAIIGIVSTKPGIELGGELAVPSGAKKHPVALAGRVPVTLSTENGPIEIGDRIVLSSIPGVGMKEDPTKSGTVVGIAIERFDGTQALSAGTIQAQTEKRPSGSPICTTKAVSGDGKAWGGSSIDISQSKPSSGVSYETTCYEETIEVIPTGGPASSVSTPSGENVKIGQALVFVNLDKKVLTASGGVANVLSGDLSLDGGGNILNVKGIASLSGKWSISEDGHLVVESITAKKGTFTESLEVGTPERRTGITIYDTVTGAPFCFQIASGVMSSVSGKCEDVPSGNTTSSGSSDSSGTDTSGGSSGGGDTTPPVEEPPSVSEPAEEPAPSEPVVSEAESSEGASPVDDLGGNNSGEDQS